MVSLSNKIKQRMQELDISAHVLEKRAGLKPSAVQNIIYGRSKNPGINLIKAIAQVIGFTVEELVNERSSPAQASLDPQKMIIPSKMQPLHSDKSKNWDQQLYLECFQTVHNIITKQSKFLQKENILSIIEEAYYYSKGNNIKKPDNYFCNWLINRGSDENDRL